MVLMKMSYQDNPIAIIFIMVAWPGVAYEIDSDKKSSSDRKIREITKSQVVEIFTGVFSGGPA